MRAIKTLVAVLALQGAIEASAQPVQLFHPTNSVWRYQVDLAIQTAAGTDWITPGFDDSSWPQGKGLFGNEANYPYPMNTTGTGLGANAPAANFFRAHFNWAGTTAGVVLTGTNYIDDGSIIYLNGVEIARFNMPETANAGTPGALAPVANPGGFPNVNGGEPVLVQLQIDLDGLTNGNANPLVTGDNVVAVQAHQNSATSSDRAFGLALYGSQALAPCFSTTAPIQPTNRVLVVGRSTTFTSIEQCAVPAATFQWYRDVGAGEEAIAGATGANYTLTNAAVADSGVYYVKATNSKGTATSRQATLTVNADNQPPKLLTGRLGANNTEMLVTADEPLCPDDSCAGNATLSFNYEIFVEGDEGNQLTIGGVVVNGNRLTFTLDGSTPWQVDTRYVIRLQLFGGGSIGDLYGNLLNGGDPFSSVTTPAAAGAIAVGNTGSELYTFDFNPGALEFSTFTWAGGAGDAATLATVDAAAKNLDGAAINERLPEATGNPPGTSTTARYASDTLNLITRPTLVFGNVIMAHLRNVSSAAQNGLTITYDLTDRATGTSEEVRGHLVYYSASGAPNTWTAVGGDAFNNGVTGPKTAILDLRSSPWPVGADMYVLFADDNGGGTEGILEIDNFKVALGGIVIDTNAPTLTRAVSGDSTTIRLTFSEPMAASAGTTAPYTVSGATVTGATLSGDARQVTLTTTARPVGTSTVTITGLRDASAEANLTAPNPISFRLTTVQEVVDWGSSWQYATNSQDADATWKTTGGTGWQTGSGLFGTEPSAGVIAIMPTPIATVIPPPNTANDFLVSYFRQTINLPALGAGQSYALGHITDDGLVAYLDGVEIGRFNMPAGPVAHGTNAIAGIEGALLALPFTATAGSHVLAVEVHQNANTSSDMLFGAQVIIVPTAPSLTISQSGTNALVSWNADSSWVLVGSANVAGPYTPVAGAAAPSFSRPIATPATQFYKLNYVPQP